MAYFFIHAWVKQIVQDNDIQMGCTTMAIQAANKETQ